MFLPAESAVGVSFKPSPQMVKSLPSIGRVLIMDDEAMLRNLATLMLKSLGIEAEEAVDGAEAIRKLLKMDPNVKAIFSSGYFDDPVMGDFKAYGFHSALPKPYRKQDLENALKALAG